MALAMRPTDPENPFMAREMPAAKTIDEVLPSQEVYLKLYPSIHIPKQQIKFLDNLRYNKKTRGDKKLELMRDFVVGRQIKFVQETDLLKAFDDAEISALLDGLTLSQKSLFDCYLRRILNGIALCEGPFGTGKTTTIWILARILAKENKRMLCVTARNAGCDHIVERLKQHQIDSSAFVYIHSTIRQHARVGQVGRLLPADPEPPRNDASETSKSKTFGPEGEEEDSGTANVQEATTASQAVIDELFPAFEKSSEAPEVEPAATENQDEVKVDVDA